MLSYLRKPTDLDLAKVLYVQGYKGSRHYFIATSRKVITKPRNPIIRDKKKIILITLSHQVQVDLTYWSRGFVVEKVVAALVHHLDDVGARTQLIGGGDLHQQVHHRRPEEKGVC